MSRPSRFRQEYRPWTGAKPSKPIKTKQGFIIPDDHFVQETSYKADYKVINTFLIPKSVWVKPKNAHRERLLCYGMGRAESSRAPLPVPTPGFHGDSLQPSCTQPESEACTKQIFALENARKKCLISRRQSAASAEGCTRRVCAAVSTESGTRTSGNGEHLQTSLMLPLRSVG